MSEPTAHTRLIQPIVGFEFEVALPVKLAQNILNADDLEALALGHSRDESPPKWRRVIKTQLTEHLVKRGYEEAGISRAVNTLTVVEERSAVFSGHVQAVKLLQQHGADINASCIISGLPETPMLCAAKLGHVRLTEYLIAQKCLTDQDKDTILW